jgi:phosphoribosylanthranilate isomerase
MPFTLLPAIDVVDGEVARFRADDDDPVTPRSPLEFARNWLADGAEWLHLADLDAAFGRGSNLGLLRDLISECPVSVQLSAGVRDDASLESALSMNCERIVIAADALRDMQWCGRVVKAHRDRVAVALDVAVETQSDGSDRYRLSPRNGATVEIGVREALDRLEDAGCGVLVVTDVARDGGLSGPNVSVSRAVAGWTQAQVIASGGVSSVDDVVALAHCSLDHPNVVGTVIGASLLTGHVDLVDALAAVRATLSGP